MAKNVVINVRVDTKDGEKSIGSLNSEVKTTLITLRDMEEASQALTEALKDTRVGTEQYEKLRKEIIKVNTEIKNQELAMEALDNEQVASEIKSVAGGLTDMAGGMALVGASGKKMEEIVQTFAKVEGASKIATGAIEGYQSMMKLSGTITAQLAAAQNFLAAAQLKSGVASKAAAVGMRILNAVMNANPVFLIITALTALVGALAWFMLSTDEAAEAQAAFNKELAAEREELNKNNSELQKNADHKLALAQILGASEEEQHKLRLEKLRVEEKARKDNIELEKKEIETKRMLYKQALDDGEDETAESLREEITSSRDRYKTLIAQNGDYNRAVILENAKYNVAVKKEHEKEIEDNKAKNEQQLKDDADALAKRIDAYKKYIDNRRNAERILADLNQTLGGDEITANNLKYDRLIEDTTRNENLLQSEKLDIIKRYELLREIDELKITSDREKAERESAKIIADAKKKAQDEADAAMYTKQDEQYALLQELQNTAIENEINALVLAAEEKYALAEGNAELEKAIAIKLANDIAEINKRAAEEEEALRQEKLAAMKATADAFSQVVSAALTGGFDEINAAFAALNDTLFNEDNGLFAKMQQGSLTAMEAVAIGVETIMSVIGSVLSKQQEAAAKAREAQYNEETEALKASLANRAISEEEYNQKLIELNNQKEQAELQARRKAFKQQKAMQIVNAVIQTAQAVLSAFSSAAAVPIAGIALGPIMAGVAGALGAAQIAIISSQQFKAARGGVVPGVPSSTDSVPAMLAGGEMVINSQSATMFPSLLSDINQAGGGIPLAPSTGNAGRSGGGNVFTDNQGSGPIQAYVVENQMTKVQNRVSRLERNAEF